MGNSSSAATRPQVPENWDATQISSQKGKVAIVTGANSGIGYETALELARHGAHVVLACRNEARGQQAEANIRELLASTPDAGSVEFKQLDVSDLSSVQRFSEEFKKTHERLDLLINNAGIMAVPYGKTVDGYERQFATNHLGHFALTAQLFSLLKQSTLSRVVNVSSSTHGHASLKRFPVSGPGVMRTSEKGYSGTDVYAESKLCNLLFTNELDRRLRAHNVQGVTAVASHPGIADTNLVGSADTQNNWLLRFAQRVVMMLSLYQDASGGALPTLYAATGPAPIVGGGDYFGPGNWMEAWGSPKRAQPKPTANDASAAQVLWDESERLAKLKFDV